MKKIKAIAIDDEPPALEVIKILSSKVPFLELIETFTDGFKALDFLTKSTIDLIFLDIKMPDISGIDLLQSLGKKPMVIFTTAYSDHAVEGFELDAVDYLLKPVSIGRFVQSCNRAYELFTLRSKDEVPDHFFIKDGHNQIRVDFDKILYLEASGNYVSYVFKEKVLLERNNLSDALQSLPQEKFLRIHRSYVISINQIEKIERHQVTIGKKTIPISSSHRDKLKLLFKKDG